MDNNNSVLVLQKLVFDQIQFERIGFKNSNELDLEMQVQIGQSDRDKYRVTLTLKGLKENEYRLLVSLSGFFEFDQSELLDDKLMQNMINKNAVAILMPYLRSEVTLLTAQPDTDNVVLPAFNINKMLENAEKK